MSAHTGDFTFRVAQRIAGQDGPWSDFRTVTLEPWDQFGAADWQVEDQGAAAGGTARIRIFAVPPGTTDVEARIGAGSWTSLSLARPGVALLTGFTDDVEASVTLRAVIGGGRVASAAKTLTTMTPAVATASSVTYFAGTPGEITFTFSEARPVRQYWDGSWAVQGPVTITGTTPASVATGADEGPAQGEGGALTGGARPLHGLELNPASANGNETQGFDDRRRVTNGANFTYDPAKNVDPGATASSLVVAAGNVVVKARSAPGLDSGARRKIENYAILHVVSELPPPNSFRPPVRGADRSARWKPSDLRIEAIAPYAAPAAIPSYAVALSKMAGGPDVCWHSSLDAGRQISSRQRTGSYAPDIADDWHTVALTALTDRVTEAERRTLLSHLVQSGIDHWGLLSLGGGWEQQGALAGARTAPVVYAATLLQDPALETEADFATRTGVLPEDRAIFRIRPGDVGRGLLEEDNAGRPPRLRYQTGHIGFPEWGEQHSDKPNRDSADIEAFYRFLSSAPITESALCCHLLPGGRALWGNEVVFDYMDRYYRWALDGYMDVRNAADRHLPMSLAMYAAHRGPNVWLGDSPEQPNPPTVTASGTAITVSWTEPFPALRANGRTITRTDLRYSFDGFTWTLVRGVRSPHVLDLGLSGHARVQMRHVTDLPGPWSVNTPVAVGLPDRAVATTTGGAAAPSLLPAALTAPSALVRWWTARPMDGAPQFEATGGAVSWRAFVLNQQGRTALDFALTQPDLTLRPRLAGDVVVMAPDQHLQLLTAPTTPEGTWLMVVDIDAVDADDIAYLGHSSSSSAQHRQFMRLVQTGAGGAPFALRRTGRYGSTTDVDLQTAATVVQPARAASMAMVIGPSSRRVKLGAAPSAVETGARTMSAAYTATVVGGVNLGGGIGGTKGARVRHVVHWPGVQLTDAQIDAARAALGA